VGRHGRRPRTAVRRWDAGRRRRRHPARATRAVADLPAGGGTGRSGDRAGCGAFRELDRHRDHGVHDVHGVSAVSSRTCCAGSPRSSSA
jgi:hypothetical protein